MLSPEEMLEQFRNCKQVEDLEDYAECSQDCGDCSAAETCKQLSAGGDFAAFKAAFDEEIRPLL